MSNNALQTIINARLPGKEGLWQIHLQDGKISAIDAQSGVMPVTENSLDAEKGLVLPPFVEPHIHWTPRKLPGNRTGISPARCLKALNAGPSAKRY